MKRAVVRGRWRWAVWLGGTFLLAAVYASRLVEWPTGVERRAAPELAAAGAILEAASLDPARPVPSGGWFVVRGTNLVESPTHWPASEADPGPAPQILGGVSVTVGGVPAYVVRLQKGQGDVGDQDEVLVLAPMVESGRREVTVRTGKGETASGIAQFAEFSPSLFGQEPRERRFAEATTADGTEWIGPLDLAAEGVTDRPVRPAAQGEEVAVYANGCGPYEEAPELRLPVAVRSALKATVRVSLDDTPVEVVLAGTAEGRLPTCQIRIRVPEMADGDHELKVEINGERAVPSRWLTTGKVEYPGFEHGKQSKFRLTGAHVFLDCTQCHARSRFWGTPSACEACHLEQYQQTTIPDHREAGFPIDCASCHLTSRFRGAKGGHRAGMFALTGKHAAAACTACHTSGRFESLDRSCAGCHLAAYEATTEPNHAAAGLGRECGVCHNPSGWRGARIDHARTAFPLTGKHASAACTKCHGSADGGKPEKSCVGCHLANYQATASPNHAAAGYPTGCDACHTTTGFRPASVDHPRQRFPLNGAHGGLKCAACHADGKLTGLSGACSSCHLSAYRSTVNPDHRAANFPESCDTCHTTLGWKGAVIKHDRYTLTGKHIQTTCASCHADGRFAGTPKECEKCHIGQYEATTDPNHRKDGYPTQCQLCHSTSQFPGARFTHTNFSLTGKHLALQCSQCHASGVYAGTPRLCVGCHAAAYNGTVNPNHRAAGIPQTCETCHTTAGWKGAVFTHVRFTLTGRHTVLTCLKCHATGVYAGTPRECVGCHEAAYNATVNPNHGAAGFPRTCEICHTTAGWRGAVFLHSVYALTGKHTELKCLQCHAIGVYKGTPRECVGCHAAAYEAAKGPNHVAQDFPLTCQLCHTTAGWTPANFPHGFAIYSGKHAGKWSKCTDCHSSPGDYKVFSCFGCHQKAKIDSEHREIPGYAYDSARCIVCHPQGRKP